MIRALPAPLRARAALRTARALVRATYPGSRAIISFKQGHGVASICADRCSAKCAKRRSQPLCGFYAAAIARVLQLFDVRADAQVNECRAAGRAPGLHVVGRRCSRPRDATAGSPEHDRMSVARRRCCRRVAACRRGRAGAGAAAGSRASSSCRSRTPAATSRGSLARRGGRGAAGRRAERARRSARSRRAERDARLRAAAPAGRPPSSAARR